MRVLVLNPGYILLRQEMNLDVDEINRSNEVVFDGSRDWSPPFTRSNIKKFLSYYKDKYNIDNAVFETMDEGAASAEDNIIYRNFVWGLYHKYDYPRVDLNDRLKLFTYLGGFARASKCTVLNRLFDGDLLDKAIWSFTGATKTADGSRSICDESHFNKELFKILPKYIDMDLAEIKKVPSMFKPTWGKINLELYKSRFSLVQETEMSKLTDRYTEKTYKCLTVGHPFIVAGNYQVLKRLHKDGFKTFAPYINEDYDDIETRSNRARAVVEEVTRLCNMSELEWSDLLEHIEPILEHNYQHAKSKK